MIKNRKGMELSLNTIVIFILLLVTLVVVIYFFTTHYGDNSNILMNLSKGAIENAKNSN